jgi:putative endonuclease
MNPVKAGMYYTYVLRSDKSGRLYTGYTSDLRKRLAEHQSGKATYTKTRGPYQLIYYEACLNMKDAFAREKYLKTGPGKRYLKNRIKRLLDLTG